MWGSSGNSHVVTVLSCFVCRLSPPLQDYGLARQVFLASWIRIKPLLIIGIPIGTTIFAEMGLFSFTTLLLGRFGAEVVAAHNIAMNLNAIFFMPPMAIGMAATIRIGYRIGAGEITEDDLLQ